MNLVKNRRMHPQLRDDEALVVENAIRLAIDSIVNVLYGLNGGRAREYRKMVADRDKEIRRLERRLLHIEHELQLLRRQGCSCGLTMDTEAGRGSDEQGGFEPGTVDSETVTGQHEEEMSITVGLFSRPPSHGSSSHSHESFLPLSPRPDRIGTSHLGLDQTGTSQLDLDQTGTSQLDLDQTGTSHLDLDQTGTSHLDQDQTRSSLLDLDQTRTPNLDQDRTRSSHSSEASGGSDRSRNMLTSPSSSGGGGGDIVVKEEPCDTDAVFIKWEMVEDRSSPHPDLHQPRGQDKLQTRGKQMLMDRPESDPSEHNSTLEGEQMRRRRTVPMSELPEEAQRLKRAAWRAASRRYYARKVARQQGNAPRPAAFPPITHSHAPPPISLSNRKRRTLISELPEESQSLQREAWRAASRRYYARKVSRQTDPAHWSHHADSAHFNPHADPAHLSHPTDPAHFSHSTDSTHFSHPTDPAHFSHPTDPSHFSHPTDPAHFSHLLQDMDPSGQRPQPEGGILCS